MMLLQVQQLTKHFGAELILSNIKMEIKQKDRVALVGRNGAGKSTLLKMIAGQLSYDSGQIVQPKGVTIGYLAQNTGLESSLSIWDEMLTIFDSLRNIEQQLKTIEIDIGKPENYEEPTIYERLLRDYDQLQEQ